MHCDGERKKENIPNEGSYAIPLKKTKKLKEVGNTLLIDDTFLGLNELQGPKVLLVQMRKLSSACASRPCEGRIHWEIKKQKSAKALLESICKLEVNLC